MCAILGIYSNNFREFHLEILKELFIQSQIRGVHATGLSFFRKSSGEEELVTLKDSCASEKFVNNISLKSLSNSVIGHCRYSTSDLLYNQPIDNGVESIVHNGVVTQLDPDFWNKEYGYDCEGKNDSELILKCIESKKEPLKEFGKSSIAVIHLHSNGQLTFYRNGNRPLWYMKHEEDYYISSTSDILIRTFNKLFNVTVLPTPCKPNNIYSVGKLGLTSKCLGHTKDNQVDLECSNYYKSIK